MLKTCHTRRNFTLRTPLGCWLDTTPIQNWHTLIHPPSNTAHVKHNNLWHLYRPTIRSRSSVPFVTTSHDPPPTETLPITTNPTTNHRHQLRIYKYSKREDTIIFQQPPVTSFPQFLRNLPTHERWVIGHVIPQSTSDMNNFLEAIVIGSFGLGSDGSVKGLSTTYSSRIQSRSSLHTFITSHSKSEPTSTLRAEAYGYLGCLYLLRASRHLPPLPRSHHRYTINRPIHGQSRSPHQTLLRPSILPETPSDKEQRRHPRDSVSLNFPPIPYPLTPRSLPPK
jgi:hypothetical protein